MYMSAHMCTLRSHLLMGFVRSEPRFLDLPSCYYGMIDASFVTVRAIITIIAILSTIIIMTVSPLSVLLEFCIKGHDCAVG